MSILILNRTEATMASTYRVGIGISEVTNTAVGLQMMGFADPDQKTTGVVESPLFSRAFIVEDQTKRVVFVSVEILSGTEAVRQEVLKRLKTEFGVAYTNDNVLISGTHTHSAPGGYFGYKLYNIVGGFNSDTLECIVSGIVASIRQAHNNLRPGEIYIANGHIENCGLNRSLAAYNNNFKGDRDKYGAATDKEMLFLKFTDSSTTDHRPIGVLSWYPIHPTDRGQQNREVGGDNKGFASFLFEHAMPPQSASERFVAAFANANCGDVSGNVEYGRRPDGTDDVEHMEKHARIEYFMAKELFESASEQLVGSIDYRHKYVDMENVKISRDVMAKTYRAALGLSFTAGSSEDSVPNPNIGTYEGLVLNSRGHVDDLGLQWAHELGPLYGLFKEGVPIEDSADVKNGHFPKPIVLGVGKGGFTPKILPLQILRIGQLVIVGVPAEITTMAGRRLRETVLDELSGIGIRHLAIAAYANEYSHYITTVEEYDKQHYEGACTLFGPHTLKAYEQEFGKLAKALARGESVEPGPPLPVFTYTPPALRPPAVGYTPGGLARTISRRAEKGVGGYDLVDGRDQAFVFDYTGSGKLDHLFFFRPGSAIYSIVSYKQRQFMKVYSASDVDPRGRFLIHSLFEKYSNLRGFAFDPTYGAYSLPSQRRLDHVVFYAPGQKYIMLFKKIPRNDEGHDWVQVTAQLWTQTCDMSDVNDRAFAFDYSGQGFLDHIVVYRPGSRKIWILGESSSGLISYEQKWASQNGIAGFELSDPRDLGLAFDCEHTGRLDHLLFYRPGTGIVCIIKKDGNQFRLVYDTRNTKFGIAQSPSDRIIAFDYTNSSKPGYYYHDHLVCYGPGTGKISIIQRNSGGNFEALFVSNTGIGTYDLKGATDQILAFDYKEDVASKVAAPSSGSAAPDSGPSELFLFRPGSGLAFIVQNIVRTRRSEVFAPAYWYSGVPFSIEMTLSGILRAGGWAGGGRDGLITALKQYTAYPGPRHPPSVPRDTYYSSLNDDELIGFGANIIFLLKLCVSSIGHGVYNKDWLKKWDEGDHKNTVVAEINKRTGIPVPYLQGLSNQKLVRLALERLIASVPFSIEMTLSGILRSGGWAGEGRDGLITALKQYTLYPGPRHPPSVPRDTYYSSLKDDELIGFAANIIFLLILNDSSIGHGVYNKDWLIKWDEGDHRNTVVAEINKRTEIPISYLGSLTNQNLVRLAFGRLIAAEKR